MEHNWIGNVIVSSLDGIYSNRGEKIFDLLECFHSRFDASDRPALYKAIGSDIIEPMISIDNNGNNQFRIISDIGLRRPVRIYSGSIFGNIGDVIISGEEVLADTEGKVRADLILAKPKKVFGTKYPELVSSYISEADITNPENRSVVLGGGVASEVDMTYGDTGSVDGGDVRFAHTRDIDLGGFDITDDFSNSVDISIPYSLAGTEHILFGGNTWNSESDSDGEYGCDVEVQYKDRDGNVLFALHIFDNAHSNHIEYKEADGEWVTPKSKSGTTVHSNIKFGNGVVIVTPDNDATFEQFTASLNTSAIDTVRMVGNFDLSDYDSPDEAYYAISIERAIPYITLKDFTVAKGSPFPYKYVADYTGVIDNGN